MGLIIYEEVLSRVSAAKWSDGARGLWSNGGVYNSKYIFPNVHYYPLENWELEAAWLSVWPDRPDGAIIQCRDGDKVDCATNNATKSAIGWEVDAGLKHKWHEHAMFSLEAGYAHVTDRVPLQSSGLNPNGKFFTLQTRLAYAF